MILFYCVFRLTLVQFSLMPVARWPYTMYTPQTQGIIVSQLLNGFLTILFPQLCCRARENMELLCTKPNSSSSSSHPGRERPRQLLEALLPLYQRWQVAIRGRVPFLISNRNIGRSLVSFCHIFICFAFFIHCSEQFLVLPD